MLYIWKFYLSQILYKYWHLIIFHIHAEESDDDGSSCENSDSSDRKIDVSDSNEEIDGNAVHEVNNNDSATNQQADLDPSNDLSERPHLDWEKQPCLHRKYPKLFPFTGNSSIQVNITHKLTLDIFELFCSPDFMQLILEQANLYAEQCKGKVIMPK